MKIKRVNENIRNPHFDSKLLSKEISKMFFKDLDEFDRIVVEYDEHTKAFRYSICFSLIYKETIDAIDKFENFMNFTKDGWSFQIDNFTYDDLPKAYYEFNLPQVGVEKYLNEIDVLKKSNKYNL